jgi:hypothetical protein
MKCQVEEIDSTLVFTVRGVEEQTFRAQQTMGVQILLSSASWSHPSTDCYSHPLVLKPYELQCKGEFNLQTLECEHTDPCEFRYESETFVLESWPLQYQYQIKLRDITYHPITAWDQDQGRINIYYYMEQIQASRAPRESILLQERCVFADPLLGPVRSSWKVAGLKEGRDCCLAGCYIQMTP